MTHDICPQIPDGKIPKSSRAMNSQHSEFLRVLSPFAIQDVTKAMTQCSDTKPLDFQFDQQTLFLTLCRLSNLNQLGMALS